MRYHRSEDIVARDERDYLLQQYSTMWRRIKIKTRTSSGEDKPKFYNLRLWRRRVNKIRNHLLLQPHGRNGPHKIPMTVVVHCYLALQWGHPWQREL